MNLSSRDTISLVEIGKLKVVELLFTPITHSRSDLESEQIEIISIEFKQFRFAPILLSCFYRPPDSTVSFFDRKQRSSHRR